MALVLGVVGTGLSVVSLGWQVYSWRFSGAKLQVCFRWAYLPPEMTELLAIEVTNRGRASTVLSGVTTRLPNGKQMLLLEDALHQVQFPYEIRPGEAISVRYQPKAIERTLQNVGLPGDTELTPVACCGHGDVRGKPIRLGSSR